MRLPVALLLAVCAFPVLGQRRVIQAGAPSGNRGPGTNTENTDTRLGLLATQIGVAPVPGGIPNTGVLGQFPGGVPVRDVSCWCQPVNQVCTDLRPENLDLVTRIINRPGSPGSSLPGGIRNTANCNTDQKACCPRGASSPLVALGPGNIGFPNVGFPNNQGRFPNNQGRFPNKQGRFPNNQGRFPNNQGGFPINQGGFPINQGGFPINQGGFPINQGGFPINQGGFPINQGGFPINQGFPNAHGFQRCGVRKAFGFQRAVSPTADFGEYPWMAVVLGPGHAYIAGGVLLSESWVLTAPHKLEQTQGLVVRLGDYDVGSAVDTPNFPHYEVAVSRVIIHPRFNRKTLANDIALLQLSEPINLQQYSHVTPACLPEQGQVFDGQRCFVSGWGKDAFGPGNFQRLLQEVDVPVVNNFRCESLLRQTKLGSRFTLDKTAFMCAGGELDKDACQGDGGSPLVCGGDGVWSVAGLVAWGVRCGQQDVPAAYVNVASYTNFIRQYVN